MKIPSDLSPAECLRWAAKLIRKGWCKGHEAEDKEGNIVLPQSPEAVKWCALGAIHCVVYAGNNYKGVYLSYRLGHIAVRENDAPDASSEEVAKWLEEQSYRLEQRPGYVS